MKYVYFYCEKNEKITSGILFACFLLITGNLFRNDLLVVRERRTPKEDFRNVAYIIANIYGIKSQYIFGTYDLETHFLVEYKKRQ